MSRRKAATMTQNEALEQTIDGTEAEVETFDEVDVPEVDDEVEDIATAGDDTEKKAEKAKEPAAPKRGDLDDGFVTPVQLAKELNKPLDGNPENLEPANWRYTHSKTGEHEVVPQMVYSYLKTAKGLTIHNGVVDSNGVARNNVLNLQEALAWWDAKNERAAERAENAKAKAEKKAEKPAEAASETDGTPAGLVEEAE